MGKKKCDDVTQSLVETVGGAIDRMTIIFAAITFTWCPLLIHTKKSGLTGVFVVHILPCLFKGCVYINLQIHAATDISLRLNMSKVVSTVTYNKLTAKESIFLRFLVITKLNGKDECDDVTQSLVETVGGAIDRMMIIFAAITFTWCPLLIHTKNGGLTRLFVVDILHCLFKGCVYINLQIHAAMDISLRLNMSKVVSTLTYNKLTAKESIFLRFLVITKLNGKDECDDVKNL